MRFESEKEESADNLMSSTTAATFKSPFVRFHDSYVSGEPHKGWREDVVPRFFLSTDRQRGMRSYEVAVTGNQQPPNNPLNVFYDDHKFLLTSFHPFAETTAFCPFNSPKFTLVDKKFLDRHKYYEVKKKEEEED